MAGIKLKLQVKWAESKIRKISVDELKDKEIKEVYLNEIEKNRPNHIWEERVNVEEA